ncbi:MAG: hypothetical protein HFI55_04540 [Lachnospiraceae bacterium]|jgi:hypothetical protein|nr:hypothetical protein [Lachnospiraceae bacterium]
MIQEEKKEKREEEEELTEQEKALVRKDLALCLKLNAKLGNYQNRSAVQKIYDWVAMEPRFHTVIGKRYVKRLGDILEGETDFVDCVLCNGFMIDGTAVCEDCLNKYRNLILQSADTKEQTGNGTVQKMATISERAADTARQMSATAKENLHTMSARISEFTEENETVNAAKDKLKEMADSGMEKLQNNPEAARAMEKGKEQVKKAQGKWRGMSRKKRIVIAAVCALLLLGGMSGASGKSGSGGENIKTESAEDAMQLAQTLYPETKGYSLTAGGKKTYSASDLQNDRSNKSNRAMFNLRVGESLADQDAVTEAYQKTDFSQDFTYYYIYIYKGYDHLKDCMISEDGRVVEVAGGSYIRVR